MTRLALWVALVVMVGVAVGCEPAKELPDEIPQPQDSTPAIPIQSQPAAKEYVEKHVLPSYTGGKPELLVKGKNTRLVLKGKMLPPAQAQAAMVDATRTIAAVWPDRFVGTNEMHGPDKTPSLSAYLRESTLTVISGDQKQEFENLGEVSRNFTADQVGQYWMALMLPLTDPEAIVFDLQSRISVVNGQPVPLQVFQLSRKGFPVYHLTFDAKSHVILRVDYTLNELGNNIRRSWIMIDHKLSAEGLVLPGKMQYRQNDAVVEEWQEAKWEFPATIADEQFSPPVPKK